MPGPSCFLHQASWQTQHQALQTLHKPCLHLVHETCITVFHHANASQLVLLGFDSQLFQQTLEKRLPDVTIALRLFIAIVHLCFWVRFCTPVVCQLQCGWLLEHPVHLQHTSSWASSPESVGVIFIALTSYMAVAYLANFSPFLSCLQECLWPRGNPGSTV